MSILRASNLFDYTNYSKLRSKLFASASKLHECFQEGRDLVLESMDTGPGNLSDIAAKVNAAYEEYLSTKDKRAYVIVLDEQQSLYRNRVLTFLK